MGCRSCGEKHFETSVGSKKIHNRDSVKETENTQKRQVAKLKKRFINPSCEKGKKISYYCYYKREARGKNFHRCYQTEQDAEA